MGLHGGFPVAQIKQIQTVLGARLHLKLPLKLNACLLPSALLTFKILPARFFVIWHAALNFHGLVLGIMPDGGTRDTWYQTVAGQIPIPLN